MAAVTGKKNQCAYKHSFLKSNNSQLDKIAALQKRVEDLIDFKKKSEIQINDLKKDLRTLQSKLSNKAVLTDSSEASCKIDKLQQDFKLLKSEILL